MSKKQAGQRQAPTVTDVARMKSGFAKQQGGATPPPEHIRRIESVASKAASREASEMGGRQSNGSDTPSKHDQDNRSAQLNPNNDAYWQSRGEDSRPVDWRDRIQSGQEE